MSGTPSDNFLSTVKKWLFEYACKNRMVQVIQGFSKLDNEKDNSLESTSIVWLAIVYLEIQAKDFDSSQQEELESLLNIVDNIYTSCDDCIDFTLYYKISIGLKALLLFRILESGGKDALQRLNHLLPREGIIYPSTAKLPEQKRIEYDDMIRQFRKMLLRMMKNKSAWQKFQAEEYHQLFGKDFLLKMQDLTTRFIASVEDLLPVPSIIQLLQGSLHVFERSDSISLTMLLDHLYRKTSLTEDNVLAIMADLWPSAVCRQDVTKLQCIIASQDDSMPNQESDKEKSDSQGQSSDGVVEVTPEGPSSRTFSIITKPVAKIVNTSLVDNFLLSTCDGPSSTQRQTKQCEDGGAEQITAFQYHEGQGKTQKHSYKMGSAICRKRQEPYKNIQKDCHTQAMGSHRRPFHEACVNFLKKHGVTVDSSTNQNHSDLEDKNVDLHDLVDISSADDMVEEDNNNNNNNKSKSESYPDQVNDISSSCPENTPLCELECSAAFYKTGENGTTADKSTDPVTLNETGTSSYVFDRTSEVSEIDGTDPVSSGKSDKNLVSLNRTNENSISPDENSVALDITDENVISHGKTDDNLVSPDKSDENLVSQDNFDDNLNSSDKSGENQIYSDKSVENTVLPGTNNKIGVSSYKTEEKSFSPDSTNENLVSQEKNCENINIKTHGINIDGSQDFDELPVSSQENGSFYTCDSSIQNEDIFDQREKMHKADITSISKEEDVGHMEISPIHLRSPEKFPHSPHMSPLKLPLTVTQHSPEKQDMMVENEVHVPASDDSNDEEELVSPNFPSSSQEGSQVKIVPSSFSFDKFDAVCGNVDFLRKKTLPHLGKHLRKYTKACVVKVYAKKERHGGKIIYS